MLPSASRLDLALRCLGSCTLPAVYEESEAAALGTIIHQYLENARADRSAALYAVPEEYRDRCAAIDVAALPAGAESEVALGYDVWADRAVRYDLSAHRAYPADGLYHATLDLVGVVDGAVFVGDFKTGMARRRAAESFQLKLGALAACRLTGATSANVALLYEREGEWIVDRAHFDEMDLEAARLELRDLANRVERARSGLETPALVTGSHCTYCPALRLCPAQTALVRAFAAEEHTDTALAALSPEEAGAIYDRAVTIEAALDRAKAALRAIAEQSPGGLPLPDGRVLRRCNWTTTQKDAEARERLAKLTEQLTSEGHITKRATHQVRIVGRSK